MVWCGVVWCGVGQVIVITPGKKSSELLLEWRCDGHDGGRCRLCEKSYWRGDVMFMKEGGSRLCQNSYESGDVMVMEEGGPGCVRSPIGGEM